MKLTSGVVLAADKEAARKARKLRTVTVIRTTAPQKTMLTSRGLTAHSLQLQTTTRSLCSRTTAGAHWF